MCVCIIDSATLTRNRCTITMDAVGSSIILRVLCLTIVFSRWKTSLQQHKMFQKLHVYVCYRKLLQKYGSFWPVIPHITLSHISLLSSITALWICFPLCTAATTLQGCYCCFLVSIYYCVTEHLSPICCDKSPYTASFAVSITLTFM